MKGIGIASRICPNAGAGAGTFGVGIDEGFQAAPNRGPD